MTPSPKKWSCPKIFFPIFSKNVTFLEKIVGSNNIENLISNEKDIHFCPWTPLPFKRDMIPRNCFWPYFQKIQLFLKKLLNNKIISTSVVMKKVMFIFGARRSFSKKNRQMCL